MMRPIFYKLVASKRDLETTTSSGISQQHKRLKVRSLRFFPIETDFSFENTKWDQMYSCIRSEHGQNGGSYLIVGSSGQILVLKDDRDAQNHLQTTQFLSNFSFVPTTRLVSKESEEGQSLYKNITKLHSFYKDSQSTFDHLSQSDHNHYQRNISSSKGLLNNWDRTNSILVMTFVTGAPLCEIDTSKYTPEKIILGQKTTDIFTSPVFLKNLAKAFIADGFACNSDRFSFWGERNQANLMVDENLNIHLIDNEFSPSLLVKDKESKDLRATTHIDKLRRIISVIQSIGNKDQFEPESLMEIMYYISSMVHPRAAYEFKTPQVRGLIKGLIEGLVIAKELANSQSFKDEFFRKAIKDFISLAQDFNPPTKANLDDLFQSTDFAKKYVLFIRE